MENDVVVKQLGPLNYLVKIGNQTKKVHIDYMLPNSLTDNDLTPLMIGILVLWKYFLHKSHLLTMILLVPVLVTIPRQGGIHKDPCEMF